MGRPREFDEGEVVARAMELFWSKGYRATTPKELLEVTGLSKSSLYATFGSKQGLFLKTLERYIAEQTRGVTALLQADTIEEVVRGMFDQTLATIEARPQGRACMMCATALEADHDEILQAILGEASASVVSLLQARLERALDEGELSSKQDPAALARLLFNHNAGLVVHARTGATLDQLRATTDALLHMLFS